MQVALIYGDLRENFRSRKSLEAMDYSNHYNTQRTQPYELEALRFQNESIVLQIALTTET
jgi:hypothetical protein